MKTYFVIRTDENGASFEAMPEAMLLSRLNESYWGSDITVWTPAMLDKEARGDMTRIDLSATSFFLIIHGEVIVPKPEKVVETWSVR